MYHPQSGDARSPPSLCRYATAQRVEDNAPACNYAAYRRRQAVG